MRSRGSSILQRVLEGAAVAGKRLTLKYHGVPLQPINSEDLGKATMLTSTVCDNSMHTPGNWKTTSETEKRQALRILQKARKPETRHPTWNTMLDSDLGVSFC